MSINSVQITSAEEKYAPPGEIIELTVMEGDMDQLVREEGDGETKYWNLKHARQLVLLSVSDYTETHEGSSLKRKVDFPPIYLNDLLRALAVFGVGVGSYHVGDPPVRLPAPPQEPTAE